ncbi:ABC transporter transmembrane domain-containing protein [Aestuariivita boseongensis]|uniref:ABC transporter transmembrane domain-containing protein n=1 Tax=Aestuariivita boseongensis TaxID=1470562 RepID=UPI00316AC9A4
MWKYSKRDQLVLLAVTTCLFPLLYLTLELPKRIINDAIGAGSSPVQFMGYSVEQVVLLSILCGAFLLSVLAHGLLKMRINTMKGILSERMLRRFRYTLIARVTRFPQPYFERTSQGELVSMITSEAEPMGGLMGDAISQPVLQAGQMLTILSFLFLQSFWFGLAAIALIPLQAWLIPMLQRQINQLNKKRIVQVRAFAAEIGETAQGASTLRANGGWRFRLSMITDRLARLFTIRFEIYQKKFFMKFLNNFINQLTPFFFYLVGGLLVIQGEITVGALVAALAAYKDIASPWKELLAYYNQVQDMSLRWEIITERFAPEGMTDEALFTGQPEGEPDLKGPITLKHVNVRDADGNSVLEDLNVTLNEGAMIGVTAPSEEDRRAFSEVLVREVQPAGGSVTIADQPLAGLHQAVVARQIGHASARPVLFQGTFLENVLMPLKYQPLSKEGMEAAILDAERSGNSGDPLLADWLDPSLAGLEDEAALRGWMLKLVDALGSAPTFFRRGLDMRADAVQTPELTQAIIDARTSLKEELRATGLDRAVHWLNPVAYNPALPVGDNLLYASPLKPITQEALAQETEFLAFLREQKIDAGLIALSRDVIDMLRQIFGMDGTDHPLFHKLGLEEGTYAKAAELVSAHDDSGELSDDDLALLMTIPFGISAEQIGPAFPEAMQEQILELRATHGQDMREKLKSLYVPLSSSAWAPGMSVLENALYGKVSDTAGARADEVRRKAAEYLERAGLRDLVVALVFDCPVPLGGANMPSILAEPLAVMRAAIKRPNVLVLDNVLASRERDERQEAYEKLHELLPGTTMVVLSDSFPAGAVFEQQLDLQQGRLVAHGETVAAEQDGAASADLTRKLRALEQTHLFSGLGRRQLRLLAFGARWYDAQAGEYVFYKGDPPIDGAYMVIEGEAGLYLPKDGEDDQLITTVGPGTLVGELGLIRNVPRALDMKAETDLRCLRIGAEEFLAVVENDAQTAFKLLQVVAGYVSN